MSEPESFESTGHLSVSLQRSVIEVEAAITRLGVRPTMILNGVKYYGPGAAGQVRALVRPEKQRNP